MAPPRRPLPDDIVCEFDWADLYINRRSGRVYLVQEWNYTWLSMPGTQSWTLQDKQEFHAWLEDGARFWDEERPRLMPKSGPLYRRFPGGLPIYNDIKWVLRGGHWQVTVEKVNSSSPPPKPVVNPQRRTIRFTLGKNGGPNYGGTAFFQGLKGDLKGYGSNVEWRGQLAWIAKEINRKHIGSSFEVPEPPAPLGEWKPEFKKGCEEASSCTIELRK